MAVVHSSHFVYPFHLIFIVDIPALQLTRSNHYLRQVCNQTAPVCWSSAKLSIVQKCAVGPSCSHRRHACCTMKKTEASVSKHARNETITVGRLSAKLILVNILHSFHLVLIADVPVIQHNSSSNHLQHVRNEKTTMCWSPVNLLIVKICMRSTLFSSPTCLLFNEQGRVII